MHTNTAYNKLIGFFDEAQIKFLEGTLLTKAQAAIVSCRDNVQQCIDSTFDDSLHEYFTEFLTEAYASNILKPGHTRVDDQTINNAGGAFIDVVKKSAQAVINEALGRPMTPPGKGSKGFLKSDKYARIFEKSEKKVAK